MEAEKKEAPAIVGHRRGYESLPVNSHLDSGPTATLTSNTSFLRQFFSAQGPPQLVIVTFLTTFSYGLIVADLPKVGTQRFASSNYGYNETDCSSFFQDYLDKPTECMQGSADAQSAHAFSELVANLLMFLTGPLLGAISDRRGRRGLFAFGTFLTVLANFAFLYVLLEPHTDPWVFYYVRSLHGLSNSMVLALASLADVMQPTLRAPAVGLLMAAYWFGIGIGPTFASSMEDVRAAIVGCFTGVSAVALALFWVPETRPHDLAQDVSRQIDLTLGSNSTTLQNIRWHLLRPLRELTILNRDGFFRLLSMLAFFNGMVTAGDKVLILYYVDSKLSFSVHDIALLLLLYGFGSVFAQAVVLTPLNDAVGERMVVIICFVAAVFSNITYGFATSRGPLFCGIALASLGGMAFPTFSAIKSNNVDKSEQGRVQGALYSILALASAIGPLVMRFVESTASSVFFGPGIMFLFAACLQLIATGLSFYLPPERSNSEFISHSNKSITDVQYTGEGTQMMMM